MLSCFAPDLYPSKPRPMAARLCRLCRSCGGERQPRHAPPYRRKAATPPCAAEPISNRNHDAPCRRPTATTGKALENGQISACAAQRVSGSAKGSSPADGIETASDGSDPTGSWAQDSGKRLRPDPTMHHRGLCPAARGAAPPARSITWRDAGCSLKALADPPRPRPKRSPARRSGSGQPRICHDGPKGPSGRQKPQMDEDGGEGGTRTPDPAIMSRML